MGIPAMCRFFRIEPPGRASIFSEWALRPAETERTTVKNPTWRAALAAYEMALDTMAPEHVIAAALEAFLSVNA